jgi:AI-2 transport protein TqsA
MIPFVLALLVASLASPIVDFQVARWKFPRWLAVTFSMLVVLAVIVVFCLMLIVAIQSVLAAVGEYSRDLSSLSERFLDRLAQMGFRVEEEKISNEIQAQLPSAAAATLGTITELIGSSALILAFVVFLLIGRSTHPPVADVYADIDAKVRKYLWIKLVVSAVTGLLVWFLLWLLDMPLAFVFGILTFLLNFIPSLGSIVATFLPLPLAVSHYESAWPVVAVIALPGAVQITIGNLVEPKLQGLGLRLHPVVVLLSLALWGLLWGIPGMVLAAPITAILRIVLMQFETTRPLGLLLAGQLPQVSLKQDA